MKPVLVKKAYLPTIDEARGVSLDDIQSLRWIPERHRKTFAQPISASRSRKEGVGQTIPWELKVPEKENSLPLPGLLDESKTGINPRRDVAGTWVGPSNLGTLIQPDFTFDPRIESGILLGTTESPHWWRTMAQGAKTHAGEGFQYGGFPKESFVEIPRPHNASPSEIEYEGNKIVAGTSEPSPEISDFIQQFPYEQGTHRWGQAMGSPLTEQQLIDQGLITPLSYEQRIVDSPFLPRKVASEPMDIAMRLLKNEPADYADTYQQVRNNIDADGKHITDEELNAIDERYSELHDNESHLGEYYNLLEAIELEKKRRAEGSFDGIGHNEETGFTRSEPMDIALQLLKERVSPEAKRHKLEYDKKYESSPERVKYREDLNRERRRRGIYGSHNHQDVSHTEGGKLTLESEHENRARHFKDKGTLREM